MTPRCYVSARAFARIVAELDRTSPREGIAVPLVALRPHARDRNPCAPLELDALAEVVIGAVVLVPPHLQVNAALRVRVRPDTDRLLNRRIERLVERFPRLRACAYLHSHPFARGTTWPSGGTTGDHGGHMLPLLARNREAGLNTSFSFIACRDRTGTGWILQAFALDRARAIVDLGPVRVVADGAARVRAALTPALARRPDARAALARWERRLARRGTCCVRDDLFDGWLRLVVDEACGTCLVALVPPEFPRRAPALYRVDRATGHSERLHA